MLHLSSSFEISNGTYSHACMWHSNIAMGRMHPIKGQAGGVVPTVTGWSKKLLAASFHPIINAAQSGSPTSSSKWVGEPNPHRTVCNSQYLVYTTVHMLCTVRIQSSMQRNFLCNAQSSLLAKYNTHVCYKLLLQFKV